MTRLNLFCLILVLVLVGFLRFNPAEAQNSLQISDLSASVTTSPAQCIPQNTSRKTLSMANAAALGAGNIWYCIAGPGQGCTPAANAKGSYPITPLSYNYWPPGGGAPINALYCISDSGTAFLSAYQGQ